MEKFRKSDIPEQWLSEKQIFQKNDIPNEGKIRKSDIPKEWFMISW